MGTGHAHGWHQHGHGHARESYGTAFALGTGLNLTFVVVEAMFGVIGHSTALLADAGHNLSDVFGLLVAWGGLALTQQVASGRFTYGYRSSSILAALFNAMFLLIAVGAIAWEAFHRFADPQPVAGKTVMVVAAVGMGVNGFTALMFASGRKDDINIRGAFLHMAADAAVSAGVVMAGALILLTGWLRLDPAISLVICAVILWTTWGLMTDAVRMSLAAVPSGIDPSDVRTYLQQLPGVARVYDLHIWPLSTTETALTCHLVMPDGHPGDAFLTRTAQELGGRFSIGHPTIQIETSGDKACPLAPGAGL